MSSIPRL
ncbi:hypothetical protein AYI68_g4494, partial [Smittium mucronatum]